MSYLGNSYSPLIFGPNTVDDIVPNGVDAQYILSQEVPGGYEANVSVYRRKFYEQRLAINTTVFLDTSSEVIEIQDPDIAAAFSQILSPPIGAFLSTQVRMTGFVGVEAANNNIKYLIDANPVRTFYDADNGIFKIGLYTPSSNLVGTTGSYSGISVDIFFIGPWEVLEPVVDYTIVSSEGLRHRVISLAQIPSIDDSIYVVHRGEATNNFVPTNNSVGPAQLSENLRNFRVDRFVGNGSDLVFNLSQEAVSPNSLQVYLDGVEVDGDDPENGFTTGDWFLESGLTSIRFKIPPPASTQIKVRHLGFSTISKRALFVPGQTQSVLGPAQVQTFNIQSGAVDSSLLAPNSVQNIHLGTDIVSGDNLILENNEYLRSIDSLAAPRGIIKLDSGDNLVLNPSGSVILEADTTEIVPNSAVNLGTPSNRFQNLYLSANLTAQGSATLGTDLTVVGNVSISGTTGLQNVTMGPGTTIDGIDIDVNANDVDNRLTSLEALVQFDLVPIGTVVMFAGHLNANPNTPTLPQLPNGWLLCDGAQYDPLDPEYTDLFDVIGYAYGQNGTLFRVPDLRQKMPIGIKDAQDPEGINSSETASRLGETGGMLDHAHDLPNHRHFMGHEHTVAGHHHSHDTGVGSNIAIDLSGQHVTEISHKHEVFDTNEDGEHYHTQNNIDPITGLVFSDPARILRAISDVNPLNTALNPKHTHNLASSGSTSQQLESDLVTTERHVHYFENSTFSPASASDTDAGAHYHETGAVRLDQATAPTGGTLYPVVAEGSPNQTLRIPGTGVNGSHTHMFSGTTEEQLDNHFHVVSGTTEFDNSAHDHMVLGRINQLDSEHAHEIDIPQHIEDSPSDGTHNHPTTFFTGALGNVAGGINGNDDQTSSQPTGTDLVDNGTEDEAVTGYVTEGGPGESEGNNPPYVTLNFLIRYKPNI